MRYCKAHDSYDTDGDGRCSEVENAVPEMKSRMSGCHFIEGDIKERINELERKVDSLENSIVKLAENVCKLTDTIAEEKNEIH